MAKTLTLTFVLRDGEVLLGQKQRGFGAGLWNGYGGKVEAGESVEAAARRELYEESGLTAETLTSVGELTFTYADSGEVMHVHVFVAETTGEPVATEEMHPSWFPLDTLPFAAMWSDDPHWLPQLLGGATIAAQFTFSAPETADGRANVLAAAVHETGRWKS